MLLLVFVHIRMVVILYFFKLQIDNALGKVNKQVQKKKTKNNK